MHLDVKKLAELAGDATIATISGSLQCIHVEAGSHGACGINAE